MRLFLHAGKTLFSFALLLTLFAFSAGAQTDAWEQATADFAKSGARHPNDGEESGRTLQKLDEVKAVRFLVAYLAKDQSAGMRIKAIGALGWPGMKAAIPALSTIALDSAEDVELRSYALNPGLCYMNDAAAVQTAKLLVDDAAEKVRISAYWVLGQSKTEEAVRVLGDCLRKHKGRELQSLIYALRYTQYPKVGQLVCDTFPNPDTNDAEFVRAYTAALVSSPVANAQDVMLHLLENKDVLVHRNVLHYFGNYPQPGVSKYLLKSLADKNSFVGRGLEIYPLLWAFYISPKIDDETKAKLKQHLAAMNSELEYVSKRLQKQPARQDRNTEVLDVYEAVFRRLFARNTSGAHAHGPIQASFLTLEGKDPSPEFLVRFKDSDLPVRNGTEFKVGEGIKFNVNGCRWVDDNQAVVSGGSYLGDLGASGNLYLVIRKDGKWIVVKDEMIWIS